MDGDEMARMMWQQVKEFLILPFLDIEFKYFGRGSKPCNTFRVAIDLAMGKAFKSHIVSVT